MENVQRPLYLTSLTVAASLLAVAVAIAMAGCGQFFPSATTITSLQISPLNSVTQPGKTQQYTATATYGNNTSGDATSQVTWASSATNIATISTGGLATGVSLGTTTISATSGSVIANTTLTISNKTVTSLTVAPATISLISGQTQQLSATATYSDSTTSDVTASATWTSNATAVATVTTSGLVTAVSTGTATISAVYGGQTGVSTVTVQ